jgi:hypothetical protein
LWQEKFFYGGRLECTGFQDEEGNSVEELEATTIVAVDW